MIDPKQMFGRLGNQMFQYAALIALAEKSNNGDVYFQDEKWFKDSKETVIRLFSEGIGYLSQTAIHVRRGDYVNHPFYVQLWNTDYYERAIALFPKANFLVFSDDLTWCKEKWGSNSRFQIMEGGTELEDLNMMASCENQIVANSSFSHWCGILNPNPSKKVICPIETKYYSDGVVRTKFPKDFIQLDFEYDKFIKEIKG